MPVKKCCCPKYEEHPPQTNSGVVVNWLQNIQDSSQLTELTSFHNSPGRPSFIAYKQTNGRIEDPNDDYARNVNRLTVIDPGIYRVSLDIEYSNINSNASGTLLAQLRATSGNIVNAYTRKTNGPVSNLTESMYDIWLISSPADIYGLFQALDGNGNPISGPNNFDNISVWFRLTIERLANPDAVTLLT